MKQGLRAVRNVAFGVSWATWLLCAGCFALPATPPARARASPSTPSRHARSGLIRVVFDARGNVASAVVTRSCGSDYIDREIVAHVTKYWTGAPGTTREVPFLSNPPRSAW